MLRIGFVNILVFVVLFLLFEGTSSTLYALYHLYRGSLNEPVVAERLHTQYDPLLGWVDTPNVYRPNMYGPGIYLRTNNLGFRSNENFTVPVPAGRVRFTCAGDSFTQGYGVDNNSAWCEGLHKLDARIQAVNMGLGGYGADQAYLRYKRDGVALDHDVLLFAFITDDFLRMAGDHFVGMPKPILGLKDGKLIVNNVPVPRTSPFNSVTSRLDLRSLSLVRFIKGAFGGADTADLQDIVLAVLSDVHSIARQNGAVPVFVHLPTTLDYATDQSTSWRAFLSRELGSRGLIYVDLIEGFRKLPLSAVHPLFIPNNLLDFAGAEGHYSVPGNDYIAHELYRRLFDQPKVIQRLEAAGDRGDPIDSSGNHRDHARARTAG